MRNLVQKTLLISSLLISTTTATHASDDTMFTDLSSTLAPTLP